MSSMILSVELLELVEVKEKLFHTESVLNNTKGFNEKIIVLAKCLKSATDAKYEVFEKFQRRNFIDEIKVPNVKHNIEDPKWMEKNLMGGLPSCGVFLNQAHPQPAFGQLWARAWFTEIVFVKVCVCVPIYVCLYTPT